MLTQETGERGRKRERKTTFWVGWHKKKKRQTKSCGKKIDSKKL